jgi:hypothetical protein
MNASYQIELDILSQKSSNKPIACEQILTALIGIGGHKDGLIFL